ncbi:MFS transporter [Chelatococcus reniformis]|uniref:MFS transporter n=1 Tax=Chelatococcus reniformis TaxID=1494448 RepID=A0A916UWU6_9HYPH|nr:MFS transporter [Chelatococcus reniformis]GGC91565.1 MFS transporter [Chelatococcus reniformis]
MTSPKTGGNAVALASVCLASLMFGLEISSVPTILPTIEAVLHADFKQLQWIMNAYTIAVTTVLMATGALADRYGRKRIFVGAIVIFGLASLICGLAPNAPVLILSRFLQGMSGGAMLICQVAILSHQFREGAERARAFAAWGIIFGIGLGFGPIIGTAIVAISNWQWVFLIHAIFAIVTAVLAAGSVRESRDPDAGHLDLAGIVTLSTAVFCVTFYITQGPELGFFGPAGLAVAFVAALSLLAFVLVETRSSRPMFDFSVFRERAFSGALLGSMGMNFSFWPFMIYLPIFFQSAIGYDNVAAGAALLTYTLPTLVVPPLGERILLRFQAGIAIPTGLFVIGLGFILMWAGSGLEQASWLTLLPGCLTAGIGLGLTNTPVTNTTTAAVSSARAGMASGIDMSARMISLAINIALMGFILTAGISSWLRSAVPGAIEASRLQALAERIAAGSLVTSDVPELHSMASPDAIVHASLVHGFGLVMLYGGICVWVLALLSFLTFGRAPGKSELSLANEV